MARRGGAGGARGRGVASPPGVIIPALGGAPAPLCWDPRASLRPRLPGHPPAHPFLGRRPFLSHPRRPPRGGGSSSGGRAGAAPSKPVTRHPGSARPHPGSSLFPRRAPRSGAASSRVARWRFGHRSWPDPGAPRVPSVWPAPNQGPFALFLPCGLRAGPGGGGAPSSEPAQVSAGAGPGGASAGRGRAGEAGAPGEPCWKPSCGRAAGRPSG